MAGCIRIVKKHDYSVALLLHKELGLARLAVVNHTVGEAGELPQ